MRAAAENALERGRGVATRQQLLAVLSRNELDHEIRRGRLVRVVPRVYARPWDADLPGIAERAALAAIPGPAVVSHMSALAKWRLCPPPDALHISVEGTAKHGLGDRVVAHRVRHVPPFLPVDGVPTARREYAAVASWPMLSGSDQRAPVLVGIRERLFTLDALTSAVDAIGRQPGLAQLRSLVGAISAGCHSELELWGYLHVFDVPGLRGARRQLPVRVGGHTYYLDQAYEAELVAVELDGRAYHASAEHWERDIRRDLALATIGWQTIRLSHRPLTTDVAGCRRDVLSVLATRR